MLAFITPIQNSPGSPSQCNKVRKEKIRKEEVKLPPFTNNIVAYVKKKKKKKKRAKGHLGGSVD